MEPRQGRPFHPWRELHRVVLVEGLRQGRDHHLGDPADRLPLGRPRLSGVRAPRLPTGCGVLLVHVLPDEGPLPVRPRCPAADVPRGEGPARWRPGPGLGAHRREPATREGLQGGPRQGRPGARHLGRGQRDRRGRARPHDQEVRTRPRGRVLAHSGDVDGLARLRRTLREPHRRLDAQLLRLVRRPARRVPTGLRRPDRRPGVGGLVERRLPDHVGLQPAGHPHTRRALDDRGPLPRPEGDRGRPRLRRQREVRRRVAAGQAGHRRRTRDGDGPRRAQGVLRRPPDAVLHRVREDLHRPASPGPLGGGGRRRVHRRQVPDRRRSGLDRLDRRGRRRERRVQDRARRLPDGRARGPQRLPGPSLRRGGRGEVEPRARRRSTRRSRCSTPRPGR